MKAKSLLFLTGVIFIMLTGGRLTAQVKIGDNPGTKDPSSILELESETLGLLIPRVSLADVFDNTTVPSPANSLLVYNTNFGGEPNQVLPGFYYWRSDEVRWVRLVSSIAGPNGDVWVDGYNNVLSANSANQNLGGENCVVLGHRAFADDADTSYNVIAIGTGAAEHDTTSGDARNIFIGYQAGYYNGGYDAIIMGREAGMDNDGNNVVGLGDYTAYGNQGTNVNALGQYAAYGNTVEAYSVNALGVYAAASNSGPNVNAFGSSAAQNNQGEHVNAIGQSAAANNTGWHVIAMGYEAASSNNGDDAVAIGQQALKGSGTITEGSGNIGIGFQAGMYIASGSNNIAIGYDAQIPDPDASDQINIGNTIIRDANGVIYLNDLIRLTPTSEPANPEAGMIYFDSTYNILKCFDGANWQDLW
jgi:hypothetical protein